MNLFRRMDPNLRTMLVCFTLVGTMTGLAYASVPFYRWFCQTTGWDGTPRRAETAPGSNGLSSRVIRVHFDANVAPGLAWNFAPRDRFVDIQVGDTGITNYVAHNVSNLPNRGHATYNVIPEKVGKYFVKVACFCFSDQPMKPGETREMPVNFFVDPAILADPLLDDVNDITLSYTFFEQTGPVTVSADDEQAATAGTN